MVAMVVLLCVQNKGREHNNPDQDGGENCFNLNNEDLVYNTKYGKQVTWH